MSVTLDTNVFISALNFGGRPASLLGMAPSGKIQIDISDHIEKELVRVLREEFGWDGHRIHFMVERLRKLTNRVTPTETVAVVDDPDDNRIVECAIAGGSEYIITSDKALLRVNGYRGIKVVRPGEFLERGRGRERLRILAATIGLIFRFPASQYRTLRGDTGSAPPVR